MRTTAAKLTLYLTGLVLLVRNCLSQCRDVTTAIVEQQDHTVQVSGTFEDSTLTLHCGITDGELLHGQQLIWSEGGVEIKDSHDSQYQVTRTSSVLTFPNASGYRYGEYSCRCHNRFNYTVDTIEAFIHNTSNVFSPYCSKPASTVVPQDMQIVYHKIQTPGESITLTCDGNDTLYLLHGNNTAMVWEDPVYTVTSQAHQAKFLCISDEEVAKVHYVVIQDYLPLQFILPSNNADVITIDVSADKPIPPLCAVVSPILSDMNVMLKYTEFYSDRLGKIEPQSNGAYLHAIVHDSSLHDESSYDGYDIYCHARTVWENRTIQYSIEVKLGAVQAIVPSVAIGATVTPDSGLVTGDRAVIHCTVSTANIGVNTISVFVMYENVSYDLSLNATASDVTLRTYFLEIQDLDDEGIREYVCVATLQVPQYNNYCTWTADVAINVTGSDEDYYDDGPTVSYQVLPSVSTTSTSSMRPLLTTTTRVHFTTESGTVSRSATIDTGSSPAPSDSTVPASTSNNPELIIATVIIACLLVVAIILMVVAAVIIYFRASARRKSVGHDLADNEAPPDFFDSISISITSATLSMCRSPSFSSKAMIKFMEELTLSKWYISYNKLQVHEVLGSGAFGMVKRATGYGIVEGEKQTIVAVKMLKAYATEEEQRDIITEFNMLQRIGTHKNIVNLIGASSYKDRLAVIVEYCPGGNLLNYLRKSRKEVLSLNHQLNMALQVAEGMEYLASNKCVHRDLATRNVLITEEGMLKVADFGLARETYHSVYAKSSKGKIPYKWMSPESIFDNIYTVKSDVWSFGVLLWEISTKGQLPYPGMMLEEILEGLKAHKVLNKDDECPDELYELMLQCWKYEPSERLSFTELVSAIQSQTTGTEAFIMETPSADPDISLLPTSTLDANTPSPAPNAQDAIVLPRVLFSEELTREGNGSLPQTDSCCGQSSLHISDCSGDGYLEFNEDHFVRTSVGTTTAPMQSSGGNSEGYIAADEVFHLEVGTAAAAICHSDATRTRSHDSGIVWDIEVN